MQLTYSLLNTQADKLWAHFGQGDNASQQLCNNYQHCYSGSEQLQELPARKLNSTIFLWLLAKTLIAVDTLVYQSLPAVFQDYWVANKSCNPSQVSIKVFWTHLCIHQCRKGFASSSGIFS